MPRRKQGHTKESAADGYLKKYNAGIDLIQNEPLKCFSPTKSLVLKIKKPSAPNISIPPRYETTEQQSLEAPKSLNDINMVSQHEVNNNIVLQSDDGKNQNKRGYCDLNSNSEHLDENENRTKSTLHVNSNNVLCTSTINNFSSNNMRNKVIMFRKLDEMPSAKVTVIQTHRTSPSINTNSSTYTGNNFSSVTEILSNTLSSTARPESNTLIFGGAKQNVPDVNCKIPTPETSGTQAGEISDTIVEQNSRIPSSIYESQTSNTERFLLQINPSDTVMERTSFLQEILESKSIKSQFIKSEVEKLHTQNIQNDPCVMHNINSDKDKLGLTFKPKLYLNVNMGAGSDDPESPIHSSESQRSIKFPKITSPQILEQHISKIISENAAIVETLEPMWSRRYFKQNSSSGNEEDGRRKSRSNDERMNNTEILNKSKLQSALLRGSENVLNVQKNSLSPSKASYKDRNYSQFNNMSANVPSASIYSKIVTITSEEELKGSAIKSLLSLKQGRYSKHKNVCPSDKDLYSQHPQNPEGSIIKDLLLKSKSQEELRTEVETENKVFGESSLTQPPLYARSSSPADYSDSYTFRRHHSFSDTSSSHLLSLRDSTEKLRFKNYNAQSKSQLLTDTDIQKSTTDDAIGAILKKQLLMPLSKSPPNKRRKVSDSVLGIPKPMEFANNDKNYPKSIPAKDMASADFQPYRSRSQSVHLFGGEVRVMDGSKMKRIKINTSNSGAFTILTSSFGSSVTKSNSTESLNPMSLDIPTPISSVITQPAHNSGGVVHLPSKSVISHSPGAPELPLKLLKSRVAGVQPNDSSQVSPSAITCFPGPSSKFNDDAFANLRNLPPEEISSLSHKTSISPPFYSPIFSTSERGPEATEDFPRQSSVPTVLFTPSSPTHPSNDVETAMSTASESPKKFLSPARPTSLPLKKKPFTMVSSTLVSPETPRPKKSCVQLYRNGHAYTYLGLKCSTRSTYCSIYRPQPMFVLQETNPKLSMYSNWQVMPAKEELSGLTPAQMISFYNSKQRKDSKCIDASAQLGEPLLFTHSSYWTYRSQEPPEQPEPVKPLKELDTHVPSIVPVPSIAPEPNIPMPSDIEQEPLPVETAVGESAALSVACKSEPNTSSADESSLHVDTENTLSDGDLNHSEEDEEEEEEEGDSESSPKKRIRIFAGGYRCDAAYTYVRGRGRGRYVCEECGIRCKKPSMLKKHIRTHTDLRPFRCRHCCFAFKTKGNLTKHMKSKAHHKRCTELGVIPVPTAADDSQVDQEALAKQIEKKKAQFSEDEDDDDEEDDTDDSDEECESDASSMVASSQCNRIVSNGHEKKSDSQDQMNSSNTDDNTRAMDSASQHSVEQEAARSLLHLSALGEPSQWSIGDLADVTTMDETESVSSIVQKDQSLLSPSQFVTQSISPTAFVTSKSSVSDQWLSTDVLGHRPRSYSADIPSGSAKDGLAKYRLGKVLASDAAKSPLDASEFGSREQYTRRYSISVAREARKPRLSHPPQYGGHENETTDQPMDLSITRDLSKYKSMYGAGFIGSLMGLVTQEETGVGLSASQESLGEPYQLKALPVLSPQVMGDYESEANLEATLVPLNALESVSRSQIYVQDSGVAERKEGDIPEDPSSPDMVEYNSPTSPNAMDESSYYYAQESMAQQAAAANPDDGSTSSSRLPSSSTSSGMEEGKCICRICNKIFAKSSHLRLHVNIHYFERPFRCDNCAVSFRTKGHLQKHKRSVSHFNKVNMNLTFGTPTVDNPRPFKCGDCKIAFRIHGHLAKHLRSKMHIMKLECLGKLPFGMYAEMERSGVSLNEIDTTDCNNSLESLQVMAQKLYQRDPRRMRWQGPEHVGEATCTAPPSTIPSSVIDNFHPDNLPSFDTASNSSTISAPPIPNPNQIEQSKPETAADSDLLRLASVFTEGDNVPSSYTPSTLLPQDSNRTEGSQENESPVSLNRSGTCHICGRLFKSAKFLQVHLYCDHPTWNPPFVNEAPSPSANASIPVEEARELTCDLCGRQFADPKVLQQHVMSHAQLRPFVCDICDAGFTSSSSLVSHQASHLTSCSSAETRTVQTN